MADPDTGNSSLAAVVGDADSHITDAFSLLGDETRLSILVALWEMSEPHEEGNVATFSDLRERVGIRDSGQFNYHLNQLSGQYVKQLDTGYRLTAAGYRIVRTVIAWAERSNAHFGPVEIDRPCPLCDAAVTVSFENERVSVTCTECDGGGAPLAEGDILNVFFPPGAAVDRAPEAVYDAATTFALYLTTAMLDGLCPVCVGTVEKQVDACLDHEVDGHTCTTCESPFLAVVHMQCRLCKGPNTAPSWMAALNHPDVKETYYEHTDSEPWHRWYTFLHHGSECRETLESTDPLRVHLAFPADDARIHVTLDDEANVIDTDIET